MHMYVIMCHACLDYTTLYLNIMSVLKIGIKFITKYQVLIVLFHAYVRNHVPCMLRLYHSVPKYNERFKNRN